MGSSITEEEENFLRVAFLLLRISPAAVRIKFDKAFPATDLQKLLNQKKTKVLDRLKVRRVINQKQWDILFPNQGMAKSETFDITLMICLIRNLTNIQMQDQLPASYDTSEGADLSRIKFHRNKIAHIDDAVFSNQDFTQIWNEISQAITRLGGPSYQQICQDRKTCNLDNNDRELLNEIRNMAKDIIPKGLQGIFVNEIQQWKLQESKIVKTSAIKHAMQIIDENFCVTVVGPSGCGKSTAIHHIAIYYQQNLGYTIIPANFPHDITQFYDPHIKQMFVFDDVFGKFALESHRLMDWCTLSGKIKDILDGNQVKILTSCRTNIYRDRQFSKCEVTSKAICNLISDDLSLSSDERCLIAKSYLTEEESKRLQELSELSSFDCFPLLCKIYSLNKAPCLEKFFSSPLVVIKDELSSLKDSEDQTAYATLALFVIYNNKITEEVFSKRSGIKDVLEDISDQCELKSVFTIKVVQLQIEKLINTYIKKLDGTYTIIHDKVFDILVSFYGENMFGVILDHCTSSFLSERFIFESISISDEEFVIKEPVNTEQTDMDEEFIIKVPVNAEPTDSDEELSIKVPVNTELANSDEEFDINIPANTEQTDRDEEFCIKVPVNEEQAYFRRLLRDITEGNIVDVFCSRSLQNETYEIKFLELLKDNTGGIQNIDLQFSPEVYSTLLNTSEQACCLYVKVLLQNDWDINCKVLIEKDCDQSCNILKETDPNANCKHTVAKTPLYLACRYGGINIVQLLIDNGSNPHIFNSDNLSPLHVAISFENINIVKTLLHFNEDINLCCGCQKSPLFLACIFGYDEIAQFLIDSGCDKDKCDEFYKTPLYVATLFEQEDTVELLLRNNCNPNPYTDTMDSPLYAAISKASLNTISALLLEYGADPNVCRTSYDLRLGNSLEKFDEWSNSVLIVIPSMYLPHMKETFPTAFFLDNILDPNRRHDLSRMRGSPLLKACMSRYSRTGTIEMLLKYNCDLNVVDKEGNPPLSVATVRGNEDIVKFLLEQKVNPNVCNDYNATPLWYAATQGFIKVVEYLIDYKADPNFAVDDGETPLYAACFNGYVDIARILLENGAKLEITDQNYYTPLYAAIVHGHFHTVKVLLEYGADPNMVVLWEGFFTFPITVAINMVRRKIQESVALHKAEPSPAVAETLRFQHPFIDEPKRARNMSDVYLNEVPWRKYADIVKLLRQYKARTSF